MRPLRAHPLRVTALAMALACAAVAAIAGAYGFGAFGAAWTHPEPAWIALTICGELLAYPAYAAAYRAMVSLDSGPRLRWPLVLRVVVAGFGPFAARGGFSLDKRALHAIDGDERAAVVRVLGLPVAPALAAVVVYRTFNFAVPAMLALTVRPRLHPLLTAAHRGRVPARDERLRAAAPLSR